MLCVIQITAEPADILSKLVSTTMLPIIQFTVSSQRYVLSKSLQTPQCTALSKLLQNPNAVYYPDCCRRPVLCTIQINSIILAIQHVRYSQDLCILRPLHGLICKQRTKMRSSLWTPCVPTSSSGYTAPNAGELVRNEMEGIWKESVVAQSTFYPRPGLEMLSRTTDVVYPIDIRTCVHSSFNPFKNEFHLNNAHTARSSQKTHCLRYINQSVNAPEGHSDRLALTGSS
jgi:hypothetical protein